MAVIYVREQEDRNQHVAETAFDLVVSRTNLFWGRNLCAGTYEKSDEACENRKDPKNTRKPEGFLQLAMVLLEKTFCFMKIVSQPLRLL